MTSEYTEQDRHNENCCWTWPRDQCPGDGCRCVCHMSGEPVRTTYFDLLKEIEGYRQRSRDEDTARIRLNHARIEAEERAAKAEAERDDLVARLAAAEAALERWSRLSERLAWHLSDQLHVAKFRFKAGGYGPASSYGDDGSKALADFRALVPEGMTVPRDYEGRESVG